MSHDTEMHNNQSRDKQLQGISFESVMEKRRLDQALNVKEFAVCAGLSYSTARSWFHLAGFPVFHGHVFWEDFVRWRSEQNAINLASPPQRSEATITTPRNLPPRAAQILLEF